MYNEVYLGSQQYGDTGNEAATAHNMNDMQKNVRQSNLQLVFLQTI